jgi:hypothetical protein
VNAQPPRWQEPRPTSSGKSILFIVVVWLVILFFWWKASADELPAILQKGDPSPAAGLLLGEKDAQRAAEEIRAGRFYASEVETLRAALAAKERENAQLQAALEKATQALVLTEKVLEANERVMAQYDKALKLADASSEKSQLALEKADKRIDQLASQRNWMVALGIIGLVAGFFLGAF